MKTGWIETKELGEMFLDENGKVVRASGWRTFYPYRKVKDGWDICSGKYNPYYLAKLMKEGKAKWA